VKQGSGMHSNIGIYRRVVQVHQLLCDEAESYRAHSGPVGGSTPRGFRHHWSHELTAGDESHGRRCSHWDGAGHCVLALTLSLTCHFYCSWRLFVISFCDVRHTRNCCLIMCSAALRYCSKLLKSLLRNILLTLLKMSCTNRFLETDGWKLRN